VPAHEPKACPRCGDGFECRLGSIHRCQCVDIQLSDTTREWIARRYDDCLCRNCLQALSDAERLTSSAPAESRPISRQIREASARSAARARRVRPEDLLERMRAGPPPRGR